MRNQREIKHYSVGDYRKVADFSGEMHRFDLSKCSIEFDFSRLWRRKGDDIDNASA